MLVKDDTGQGRNKNKWRKDKTGGNSTGIGLVTLYQQPAHKS